jgi:hypothetical protein
MNRTTRRVSGALTLLVGFILLARSIPSDDPNRAIHVIAGIGLVVTGCGLLLGLGGKDEI